MDGPSMTDPMLDEQEPTGWDAIMAEHGKE